ncbi:hypothetical protein C2S53_001240 [Perilla frutescens var. hirtella]|uniref:Uncharacterized protein n=1 Tax=Perilla frutescens var. hirtella TaxID=608512 RepID=A0AAD4PF59_PERFH|nr:hypothetical protein C2S53_001240 [Perilla frutescens var. hirtella]
MDHSGYIYETIDRAKETIIEEFKNKNKCILEMHPTALRAKMITRFIHNQPIALKYCRDQTDGIDLVDSSKLKEMLFSLNPNCSILRSNEEGKIVVELVADQSFWSGASIVVKESIPLVCVIEWMNVSDKN